MKKWLIRCLTVLAMVCLIPGIALNAKAAEETVPVFCARCETMNEREVLRYEKYDSTCHRVYVTECPNCHNDGDIPYIMFHTGGTQGPTCTKGKICEKCGAEYAIPGHVWGEWSSAGNGTHIRNCKNCYKVDTASCTGGTATCSAKAVCEACGVEYGEKDLNNHDLVQHEAKAPTCTEIGWNAYETCSNCDYTTYVEIPASGHALTHHEAKTATCTEIGWDAYDTCSNCDYTTTHTETPASGHVLTNYGENWGLVFCPVCGKVENGERLELLETASAAAVDGKLPEGELVARMNQRYLSLAFVHEGKLTAPAGRVKITLPAEIVQGKRLLLIAPDGTETELPFEIVGETICFTLDFTEVENPAVLVLKPL